MSILQNAGRLFHNYLNGWYWGNSNFTAKTVSVNADRYKLLSPTLLQVNVGGSLLTNATQQVLDLSLDVTWDHGQSIGTWTANTAYHIGDLVRPTAEWLEDGANINSDVYATPAMKNTAIPYGVMSSKIDISYYHPFGQDDVTTFLSTGYVDYLPFWVKYDFGTFPKIITKLRYFPRETSGNGVPKNWVFQGSNVDSPGTAADSADWNNADPSIGKTLYTGTDVADPGVNWSPYFSFSNSIAYRHYRLHITNSWGDVYVRLNELHFVETPSVVYRCTTAGSSGSTSPAFPTTEGSTVTESGSTLQWTAYLDNTNATNRKGQNFYIYACTPITGTTPILFCSKNSTYPHNYDETNSRLIGGFHCLCEHLSVPAVWKGGVVAAAALGVGGTGYSVGDVLTLTGGNNDAKVTISNVSAGVVTNITLDVYNTGTGYTAGTLATTGGGNNDCTITVTIKSRVLSETVVPSTEAITATPALANYWYRCIDFGTSHTTTEPTWNQVVGASPATDGQVIWMCENKHSLADYVAGDILPNSVWDLRYRAVTETNDGLVYCPELNKWVGIYLPSVSSGVYSHTFGGTIADTLDWNQAVDAGASLKMQLARDSEFEVFTEGSNQKTIIYGAADPVTVTGAVDTLGRRCVSNIGVEGCCGVMYQWLDEQGYQYKNAPAHYHKLTGVTGDIESKTSGNAVAADGTTAQDLAPAWGWKALGNYRGSLYGQDSTTNYGDVKVVAGGSYDTTTSPAIDCGSLCRRLDYPRWTTAVNISFRLVAKHVEREYI
jgi:hypothetical protein